MEQLTSQEFDTWVENLFHNEPDNVAALYSALNISELPSPQSMMLAAIKNGDLFFEYISKFKTQPSSVLRADGNNVEAIKGFFAKAMTVAQGAATAAQLFGSVAGAIDGKPEEIQPKQEIKSDDSYTIFGKPVKKVYVWLGGGFILLVGVFLLVRKKIL